MNPGASRPQAVPACPPSSCTTSTSRATALVTFAAWLGFDSPLRRHPVPSTCLSGGHAVWWFVRAEDHDAALALLPHYVAERTTPIEVREIEIP